MKFIRALALTAALILPPVHASTFVNCAILLQRTENTFSGYVTKAKDKPAGTAREMLLVIKILFGNHDVEFLERNDQKGNSELLIARSDRSSLNRFAHEIGELHNAEVVFNPALILENGGNFGSVVVDYLALDRTAYAMGWQTIVDCLRGEDLWSDPIVAHEVNHLVTITNLSQHVESPQYGYITTNELSEFPAKDLHEAKDVQSYEKYFSFDEITSFDAELKSRFKRIQTQLEAGADPKELKDEISICVTDTAFIWEFTKRVAAFTASVLKEVKPGLHFSRRGDLTAATIELPSSSLSANIFLVSSSGEDDPANVYLLDQQLIRLKEFAAVAQDHATRLTPIVNEMLDTDELPPLLARALEIFAQHPIPSKS